MTAKFVLDTDSVSYALRGEGRVGERLLAQPPSRICVSAITLAKLRYGAERRDSSRLRALIDTFTSSVAVMPFDEESATAFGKLSAKLVAKGEPIGHYDALIAAHAISLGVTLVTDDQKHFSQVEGLTLANWA